MVGSSNGEGSGCFERVFNNTRVKVKLLMSMYWCSPLRRLLFVFLYLLISI